MNFDDPLIRMAMVLVSGIIGGELVGRIKLPKVTGWIGTGILLRMLDGYLTTSHGLKLGLDPDAVSTFGPYMNFVLGYIAFTVGAALHFASLQNTGKRLGLLLLCEALITPAVVFFSLFILGGMDTKPALLLSAIAICGAPGTTVLVVQEARARGILTRTLVAAVALIDMVAVGMFEFVYAFIRVPGGGTMSLQAGLVNVGTEFGLALAVGFTCAGLALILIRTVVGPAFVGPIMVAVILGSWGAARGMDVSGILACTFAGIAVSNLRHGTVRSTEAYLQSIGGVLFAAFYTFAGMKLDFSQVWPNLSLVLLFFAFRFIGKYSGAFIAMYFANATNAVRNFLGLALLPHGGVAVGLILLVQNDPTLSDHADVITTVGLAALAINQLLGPSGARFALNSVGESGKARPRLLDFLDEHRITVTVDGNTKQAVVSSLVDQLYATSDMPIEKEEFVRQVMKREASESTCVGHGLMIPHAILDADAKMEGVLGISRKGLDFRTPDGRPVHAVLLLATPENERERHLEILSAFAHLITHDENLCEQLYHARSAAHAYNVLHAEAAEEINYFLEEVLEEFRDPNPSKPNP
ncbi:PTS sugar transporter subunit IIA [Fuerstiella marisgermanici]|uniref:EIIABC-Fru n=1 Tax=Fuerstiella marisgermanici TaxID=1891926 RepID=A0A1P8WJU0_9PLAN|nr:PTS sugar transporter subunit IIA [Fuerstiella marisgermanici]APZ94329.1 EIIABC-Fru [Fuerstiella marisgermanici]